MESKNFTIVLTRDSDSANDDRVTVTSYGSTSFTINYVDRFNDRKWNLETDYKGLCNYIETLAASLQFDVIDTFQDVQIQFPMYPVLCMNVPYFCLNAFQETLGKMFDTVLF
jgi:hypothetical protein